MLVILTDEQVISTARVCQGCLLANHDGQPRWTGNKLGCGRSLDKLDPYQANIYECQMGFKIAHISG